MRAHLLTIGDELLIGQVVNTNAAWIGARLDDLGLPLERVLTLPDDVTAIRCALADAAAVAEVVLVTGGLGPTHDDVTMEAVAAWLDVPLVEHGATMAAIEARFRARGIEMPPANRKQALVPEGAQVLPNTAGAAPGVWVEVEGRIVVVLPGVPFEMRTLMTEAVLPQLAALPGRRPVVHRTLLTAGVPESTLAARLEGVVAGLGPRERMAFLPGTGGVRVRLSVTGVGDDAPVGELDDLERRVRALLGADVYGLDDDTLEAAVGRLLAAGGRTLAVAESCTGGLIQHRLTNVCGASGWFHGGVVAYDNAVKTRVLGVSPDDLARVGAVSEAVARQMAAGVRRLAGTDYGLATTGIMGPTGGTPDKPVGTVWIGLATEDGAWARRFRFSHPREVNKARTATEALNLLRLRLLEAPPEKAV